MLDTLAAAVGIPAGPLALLLAMLAGYPLALGWRALPEDPTQDSMERPETSWGCGWWFGGAPPPTGPSHAALTPP